MELLERLESDSKRETHKYYIDMVLPKNMVVGHNNPIDIHHATWLQIRLAIERLSRDEKKRRYLQNKSKNKKLEKQISILKSRLKQRIKP